MSLASRWLGVEFEIVVVPNQLVRRLVSVRTHG